MRKGTKRKIEKQGAKNTRKKKINEMKMYFLFSEFISLINFLVCSVFTSYLCSLLNFFFETNFSFPLKNDLKKSKIKNIILDLTSKMSAQY